jgi:hypothetical protein
LLVIGSLVLTFMGASMENEFWGSPLLALALMFFFGTLPNENSADKFEWIYCLLIVCSGAMLAFTSEQVYWTSPLLLGVLYNLFIGELRVTIGN